MWMYKGKEFTSEDIGEYQGFVYQITDTFNGMKYIGKKGLISKRKLPPLKGKKRKRTKIVETDWKTYYGSSEWVTNLIEESGKDRFTREILHLCTTKGEQSYIEAKLQFEFEVLLKPDEYYNRFIGCKLHANHVKGLIKNEVI